MFCFHRARSGARAVRRVMLCGGALLAAAAQPAWAQTLNLDEALSRVATSDPALAANSARLDAADAAILQADVRPRDVLGADFEDFAGTGPYSPLGRAQTTGWYERTWERGGKREARIGAARAEVAVVGAQNRMRGNAAASAKRGSALRAPRSLSWARRIASACSTASRASRPHGSRRSLRKRRSRSPKHG
ncbi:hypothetical protein [Sphingobium xenophagum]|uniref:hypothetical protein n=1 Tax=Sphingobium xenophagum TaxID=121428 RepID=UPI00209ACDC1|nr:hypothetical protein [Sphingobium xenophagum]